MSASEKPQSSGERPIIQDLIKGTTYAWCSCGKSANQPWCNGAHQGTSFVPQVFEAKEDGKAAMCTCKKTKNPPFCDGSHMENSRG